MVEVSVLPEGGHQILPARKLSIPDRSISANMGSKLKPKTKKLKVKTGCYTCKFRRVKCDETRPQCRRCIKFGVDCDGYPPMAKANGVTRAILPRASQKPKSPISSDLRSIQNLHHIPSGPQFVDEQEGRCFRMYCENMADQIGGAFKSTLWNKLIPQTSEKEPFIRHAIVAIGAIGKIMQDTKISGGAPRKAVDYPYAFDQYDKALRAMRVAIAAGDKDIKKALIACILVFCFESLAGKPGSALINAESGLMLLYTWMKSNTSEELGFFASREIRQQFIEEDIMSGFAGLDLQVIFFLDTRPASVHHYMIEDGNRALEGMPTTFTSIKTVRNYCSALMRRNFHFIKLALINGRAEQDGGPGAYRDQMSVPWGHSANMFPGGNIFSTPKEPVLEMIPDMHRYLEDIRRWTEASAPVFKQYQETGTECDEILCAMLQIHQLFSELMLQSTFFVSEIQYDDILPDFKRLMVLIEYVFPHMVDVVGTNDPYHFDLGIIAPMYYVGARCRDKGIREDILRMLRSVHYREGMWDTAAAVSFIEWLREIEDEGRDENGYLPEDKRAFLTSAWVDLEGKIAILAATQRQANGGRVYLETIVRYDDI